MSYPILNRINKVSIEPELLDSLHWGNGFTLDQIGDIFGCSKSVVVNRMKKYGIQRCGNRDLTDFTFNDRQKQIFEGCMLGDGSLTWRTNNCYFSNTDIHGKYLIWLQKQLGVEYISSVKPNFVDGFADSYRLRTKVIPSIRDEYKRWYPNGKGTQGNPNHKIIPKDIELTLIKVMFWYIGDGCYTVYNSIMFTNYLSLGGAKILANKLGMLFEVNCGITTPKGIKNIDGKQYYHVCLSKAVTKIFFDIVDSLDFDIPKCCQYKFGR